MILPKALTQTSHGQPIALMIVVEVMRAHAWFIIEVVRRPFLSPLPQSIPIMTLLLLVMSRVSMSPSFEQSVVNIAHDILPKCIEAVSIMT